MKKEFMIERGRRSDPLRPAEFDPSTVEAVGFVDLAPPRNPCTPETTPGLMALGLDVEALRSEHLLTLEVHQRRMHELFGDDYDRQCAHCGAHIRWAYAVLHKPSGRTFPFGEICGDQRASLNNRDAFDKYLIKKAAESARERIKQLEVKAKWAGEHRPEAEFLAQLRAEHGNFGYRDGFIQELANKLATYGALSDKQTACVTRHMEKLVEWKQRDEERAEKLANAPAVKAGRYQVVGEVALVRERETLYGTERKMRVVADTGNGYWCSVPQLLVDKYLNALYDPAYSSLFKNDELGTFLQGMRVAVTATWTPAEKDEHFAFGKRPVVQVQDS